MNLLTEQTVRWAIRLNLSHRTGVYFILNRENQHIYIGSAARSFQARWGSHKTRLNAGEHHGPVLQAAWNKYGASAFEFGVLEDCAPSMCIEREQFWINFFRPEYNVSKVAGYVLGTKHSDASRVRRSIARKGFKHSEEAKYAMRVAATGRTHTPETRAKLSALMRSKPPPFLGKQHSPETVAKISSKKKGVKWDASRGQHYMIGRTDSDETKRVKSASAKLGWEKRRQKKCS